MSGRSSGPWRIRLLPLVLLLAGLAAARLLRPAADAPDTLVHGVETHMGTLFEITLVASASREGEGRAALGRAFEEIRRLEGLFSPRAPEGDVARINASAGESVPVAPETAGLLARAVDLCEATGGSFDVSFKPLGDLWDYRRRPFVPPEDAAVAWARELVGCRHLVVDRVASTVRLLRPGMGIGLGAIAKGYAVDRVAALLVAEGFSSCLVNGGGDVLGRGQKPSGPWIVGVRDPRGGPGDLLGEMPLRDAALVTSGDYERYAEVDGRRYAHILDPRSGRPAEGLASVTVLASTAERADAWATALLVMGPEEAQGHLGSSSGLEALLVSPKGALSMSRGFEEAYRPLGPAPSSSGD